MANLGNNRISAVLPDADFQLILTSLKQIEGALGFLVGLTPDERQMIPKVSWDNKQFVDDCMGFISTNPEYLPGYLVPGEIQKDYDLFGKLDKITGQFSVLAQKLSDTQMLAGSEDFSACLAYYRSVKQAATDGIPGAQAIYDALKRRFEAQGPRSTAASVPPAPPSPEAAAPVA
jgi:hypothetical protein